MQLVPSTREYKDTHKCIRVLNIVTQYSDNKYLLFSLPQNTSYLDRKSCHKELHVYKQEIHWTEQRFKDKKLCEMYSP